MTRSITLEATRTQPLSPVKKSESGFYNVPDSTASNLVMEVLGAGENIADLPARKKQINHSQSYAVMENGKSRQVILTTEKAAVTIELADIDKLTGSNKPAKKLFVLSLIKANEQAIHNGQLTQNYISFPLQELVDIGFYKALRSARQGFNDGTDALTSLKVKGHIQQTKKRSKDISALEVLFTGANIKNGQCTIYFNERINWGFIAQYFTILPRYYFKLPNRASDLLYYIFYIARQRTKEIEERGYFTIGFRAIQHRLQLPSEVGNTRPQQTIKQPIEEAIEQLETEHHLLYGNTEFSLLLQPDNYDSLNIKEYLDNGYLKICLTGEFAQTYIAISKDTSRQIEQAEKRRERITEKAVAIKTAQAMEDGEQKQSRL